MRLLIWRRTDTSEIKERNELGSLAKKIELTWMTHLEGGIRLVKWLDKNSSNREVIISGDKRSESTSKRTTRTRSACFCSAAVKIFSLDENPKLRILLKHS